MHRIVCPVLASSLGGAVTVDDPREVRHALTVLRLRAGDPVELLDGRGGLVCGRVGSVARDSFEVLVEQVAAVPRAQASCLIACALPKNSRFETVIEKCVELGVSGIVPLVTARTVVRGDRDRTARFRDVLLAAAKQSRCLWFPDLYPVMPLDEALARFSGGETRLFLPWLEGVRVPLARACPPGDDWQGRRVFFIGPEGDFTPEEAGLLLARGAVPVSLGPSVLRVETAALAVAAWARFIAHG